MSLVRGCSILSTPTPGVSGRIKLKNFTINHINVSFDADGTFALDIPGFEMNNCRSFPIVDDLEEAVDWQFVEQLDGELLFPVLPSPATGG